MALELVITDETRGIQAGYWRISSINISLGGEPRVEYQLDGFVSAGIRALPNGRAVQFRPLRAVGAPAMALMLRSSGAVLREQGHSVDEWPADIRAAVDALTFYAQAASTLYGYARTQGFDGAADV